MKHLLVSLTFFCLLLNAAAQPGTGWKQQKLKGKVKTLKTQETHRYRKDGVFTPWAKTYARTFSFDKTGSNTEYQEIGLNGELSYRILYVYSPKQKNTEVSYFNSQNNPTSRQMWMYDDQLRKTEEIHFDKDGKQSYRYTFTYDANGNNIERAGYKADGKLSSKTTYSYDSKNQAQGFVTETPGYANSSRKFIYDDKGNITEEAWLNGQNKIDFRFVRSYDEKGNLVKEVKYKKEETNPMDTVTWKYEYDKTGNWTKRTQFASDGTDFHVEERTYVYY